ncbi:type II toxin-antitoxin system Phd/YefM family antitoxin [Spirillospora sp. NPDC127200]
MKSTEVRADWRETLRRVENGDEIVVIHYKRPVARIIPEDPSIVVLCTGSASQAERLRQLVQQHGAVGIPFPNNGHPGWRVVDENGEPVNPHAIPSIPTRLTDHQEPPTASADNVDTNAR